VKVIILRLQILVTGKFGKCKTHTSLLYKTEDTKNIPAQDISLSWVP